MAKTFDPYSHTKPDRGQPDNVQEAWYDHLDAARAAGETDDEAQESWDRLQALRARQKGGAA